MTEIPITLGIDARPAQQGAQVFSKAVDDIKGKAGQATAATAGVTGAFDKLKTSSFSVAGALGALGIAFSATAIVGFTRNAINAVDALNDMANRVGISVRAVQEFNYIAKLSGTSVESFTSSMRFMNNALGEAATGSKTAQAAFAGLGLNFKELQALAPEDQFVLIADKIDQLGTTSEKTKAAIDIFGRGAAEILPAIEGGATAINQMKAEAEALGVVLSEDAVRDIAEFNDAIDKSSVIVQSAAAKMFAESRRAFTAIVAAAIQMGNNLAAVVKGIYEGFVAGFKQIGVILSEFAKSMALFLLNPLGGADFSGFSKALEVGFTGAFKKAYQGVKSEADSFNAAIDDALLDKLNPRTTKKRGTGRYINSAGTSGGGSGGGSDRSAVDELKRENQERQKYLNGMVLETEQLDRLAKANEISAQAYEETSLQIKIENELREKKISATSKEGQQITEMIRKQDELNKTIKGTNDAREELKRKAEEQQKIMQEPYLNAARGIQDAFSSTFEDIFTKGVDSFGDLADKVKSVMFKMAAEIAAAMVFRPVVGSVLGGALGSGATSSSSAGGGLSGIGGSIGQSVIGRALGSVSGLFSGFNNTVGAALPSLFGGGVPLFSGFGAGAAQIGSIGAGTGGLLGGLGITPATAAIGAALFAATKIFGKKKPSNKLQDSILDFGTGSVLQGGQTGNKFSQENRDAADGLTAAVQAIAGTLSSNLSQKIEGSIRIAVGARSGYSAGAINAETSYSTPEALLKGVTKGLVDGLKNVPSELQTSLDKIDFKEVEKAVGDINFALNFTKLGDFPKTISEVEQAVKSLNTQFDEAVKTATRLGLSEAEVNKARTKQLGYMRDEFNKGIFEQILGIADPQALQALEIEKEIAQLRKDAAAVGGDLNAVETLRTLKLETELKQQQIQLIEEQANTYREAETRWKSFATSLKSFREGLNFSELSPLSPDARLGAARTAFNSIASRAQLGDINAIEELQSASENLLRESKSYYASSEEYFRDFTRVQEVLQNTESVASRQANIATQQLAEAQKQTVLLQEMIKGTAAAATASAAIAQINQTQAAAVQQVVTNTATTAAATVTQAAASSATTAAASGVQNTTTGYGQINTGIRTLPSYGINTSKIRGFANGGIASGLSIVGERGPELAYFNTPTRIFNNSESRQIISGSNDNAVVSAINGLRSEFKEYRQQSANETVALKATLEAVKAENAEIRSKLSRAVAS